MIGVRPLTMLTFGPMIDSELARLLLWHHGMPFAESRHVFGWASILTLLRGGTGRVPLVFGDGLRLSGPRAIVDHFETRCTPDRMLIPPHQPQRTKVESDWANFNSELALHSARVAYFHLLPLRSIMIEPFTRGVPEFEARLTPAVYPALSALFKLLLRLELAVVNDSTDQARRIVDAVDLRLADGRRFLWGDALTLSDLSVATALAPLLLPAGCTAPFPPLSLLPGNFRRIVDEFRERPSSQLVTRIYAARGKSGQPLGDGASRSR